MNQYGGDGIEANTSLYKRSKFFFLVEMLDHLNYLDSQSFSEVVTELDELVRLTITVVVSSMHI